MANGETCLPHGVRVSNSTERRGARVLGAESASDVIAGAHLDVKRELVIYVRVDA